MLVSFNWLQEFINTQLEPSLVSEQLTKVGLAVDALNPVETDTIFDLDITANRGDCLSHLGVAREVCTALNLDLQMPEFEFEEANQSSADSFSISIADTELCDRYCGRYIEGVTIEPSPEWIVRKLESIGIRSINNVADITNYVLMELGQPLHAFDADTLNGQQIIVRRAGFDEYIELLDGKKRELDPSMLVISDLNHPAALAGIMGGTNTEISNSTKNVLLESASFDPATVRKTARSLNISTEASYRFARGTDAEIALFACNRAAALIQKVAGGKLYRGVIDIYPGQKQAIRVKLRRIRIQEYLGMEVPEKEVLRVFKRLGFEPINTLKDGWSIRVPEHRHDLFKEEDLMEEIARHYGYDRFPSTLPVWTGKGSGLPWSKEEKIIRETLSGLGYSEACTIPFSSEKKEREFAPDLDPVAIRNPLSEQTPVLRTSMVPSMLQSLLWNLNRGKRDIQLFEIGKIYPTQGEKYQLVLGGTGALQQKTVHQQQVDIDFFSMKGDIETILELFAVDRTVNKTNLPSYYHPGRSIRFGETAILGELHPSQVKAFKLRQKVYLAEIQIDKLYRLQRTEIAAKLIPKYPSIRRDLSLIFSKGTDYAAVLSVIKTENISELIEVEPFDRLLEGPFPDNCYSLALKLVYQASDRTLTDDEVHVFDQRIVGRLKSKLGAELRG